MTYRELIKEILRQADDIDAEVQIKLNKRKHETNKITDRALLKPNRIALGGAIMIEGNVKYEKYY